MFGFGGLSEVLFILFLAMLIFGPEKLPEIGRMLAKGMAEVRKASNELKRTLNAELAISEQEQEARRSAQLAAVPPPPPAWSGGQTVPNLPASDEPAAAAASVAPASEAAVSVAPVSVAPASVEPASEAAEASEAAYLRDWPAEGASAPSPAATTHAPVDAAAATATDAAALADCAVPADSAALAASRAPTPGPALLEPYGEGGGRDPA
jgi:TatA/E family protein of Tat protein translocase